MFTKWPFTTLKSFQSFSYQVKRHRNVQTLFTCTKFKRISRDRPKITWMSRLYDSIEPSVIDEALLRQCIEEQGPDGEAGKIAKQEGIEFKEVLELKLSYKSKNLLLL